jgi:hypothetical protein
MICRLNRGASDPDEDRSKLGLLYGHDLCLVHQFIRAGERPRRAFGQSGHVDQRLPCMISREPADQDDPHFWPEMAWRLPRATAIGSLSGAETGFQATELASVIDMLLHRLTCLCCPNGHPPIDPRARRDFHAAQLIQGGANHGP